MRAQSRRRCERCHAPLAEDQRYCVECGTRNGPLPDPIAGLIGARAERWRQEPAAPEDAAGWWAGAMPSPRAAAVSVMALLGFGVIVGSVVSPPTNASAPILVAVGPPPPRATTAALAPAPPPAPAPAGAPAAAAPAAAGVAPTQTVTVVRQAAPPSSAPPSSAPAPLGTSLPPVKHVFLIVLSDQGFNAAFGPSSTAPYLAKTLPRSGELVKNYYGVTGGELANRIALISGQGPTQQTAANCPTYTDITPGTVDAQGQVNGSGCVYPRQALTLPDQLTAEGKTWRAYLEGMHSAAPGTPTTCRHPAPAANDPNQAPTAADPYVTWSNPFVYFHSLLDAGACATNDVDLGQLAGDLAVEKTTPSFAYIAPDACHNGSDQPCAPGAPAGLPAADAFLRKVVPEIEASSAYRDGGLIAVTFDQAPQSGPNADSSGCCSTPPYPNLPGGGSSTGTGSAAPASPGPPPPATTGPAAPPAVTTPPVPPAATVAPVPTVPAVPPPASGPSTTTSTPPAAPGSTTTTTTASGATGTSTSTTSGSAPSPAGGGQVGLLLLSKFVKAGSMNLADQYNHFSLLRTIEDLFSLQHLGDAAPPTLLGFDRTVFNAGP